MFKRYKTADEMKILTKESIPALVEEELDYILKEIDKNARKGCYEYYRLLSMFPETEEALKKLGYKVKKDNNQCYTYRISWR